MKNAKILISVEIKEIAKRLGADAVGIAPVNPVSVKDAYLTWLSRGYHGEMAYLARYQEERFDPGRLLPGAQSIIVTGFNYCPDENNYRMIKGPYRVARYAWGNDYHRIIRQMLEKLRARLRLIVPDLKGRICVDTAPFMDKYWASQAGLGWPGKHTNLVSTTYGSWLLLGSLVIDIAIDEYDHPSDDHCGRCTACIEACPTGAITAPYCLDATRCISYQTIENKSDTIPENIALLSKGWVFGCDICLEVCPFNRFQKPRHQKELTRREEIGMVETGAVTNMTEGEFDLKFASSPLRRPGLKGLLRNIRATRISGE
nr:tRNA epoxyqueuosine(34) reductase QueG [candidate division Zixibacteria bacterium]